MGTCPNVVEYYRLKAPKLRDEAERIADECYTAKLLNIKSNGYSGAKAHLLLHPFRTIRMELFALHLHYAYLQFSLTQMDWWKMTHHPVPTQAQIFHMIESLDTNIKRGFIIGVFSIHEHTLRAWLRKIDPSLLNNGKAPYWKIKKYYLENFIDPSNRASYDSLLTLFSTIRNSLHNDGIFYPYDENDLVIKYKGNTYTFINEKPIDFTEWELLLSITEDISNFFYEVVNNSTFNTKF